MKCTDLKAKPRRKRCAVCKELFQPFNTLDVVCGVPCAVEFAGMKGEVSAQKERLRQVERKENAKALQEFNERDRGWWLKQAQKEFNKFIRNRDKGQPCISCGTTKDVQYCAGHFRTVGAAGHLRFNEDNVHLQCNRYCNSGLSGNIPGYRPAIIEKIGLERVEALENNNEIHRWTIDELKAIVDKYRTKDKKT